MKDFKNGPLEKTNFKPDPFLVVSRQHDDLVSKMSEHELADLKIGLKIFVNSDNEQYLIEALDKGLF